MSGSVCFLILTNSALGRSRSINRSIGASSAAAGDGSYPPLGRSVGRSRAEKKNPREVPTHHSFVQWIFGFYLSSLVVLFLLCCSFFSTWWLARGNAFTGDTVVGHRTDSGIRLFDTFRNIFRYRVLSHFTRCNRDLRFPIGGPKSVFSSTWTSVFSDTPE